jgi:capsid protein
MQTAIRAGLLSRSQAISAFGYDAEDIDREIAADNARADALGLVFDSDPRFDATRRDSGRSDVASAATQASDPGAASGPDPGSDTATA